MGIMLPTTVDEIKLIQPNNVTFGQYSLNEVQENVLTLIVDALQQHMTKTNALPKDLFNQPYVEIVCDEAKGANNKTNVIKAIRGMDGKKFRFRWRPTSIDKEIETEGHIITTMHNIKGTNNVIINFNPWAIPFLVYYGVGVGGTFFNKKVALRLRGDAVKRIYKIVCMWHDQRTKELSIMQFRQDLGLMEDTYDNNYELERRVLKPAVTKIHEESPNLWFEYKLICKSPVKGRKPKADTIILIIHNSNLQEAAPEVYAEYKAVYDFFAKMWNTNQSTKAMDTANTLKELGAINKVFNRIVYYQKQVELKEKTLSLAQNSLKKMLREEYKLDTETQIEKDKKAKKAKELEEKMKRLRGKNVNKKA